MNQSINPSFPAGNNSEPRDFAISGNRLPSARVVSRAIHSPKAVKSDFTLLTMQIGQVLDHDLSIVPIATEFDDTIVCCYVPESERYQ